MQIDLVKKEEISRADINLYASNLENNLKNGDISPLLLKQHFKAVSELEDSIKPVLDKFVLEEAQKYPENKFLLYGAEFTKSEFGTKYDFSKCGDTVYERLKKAADDANKALKDRENLLKNIKGHETLIDEETSEILTVYAPVKKSTSGVSCSIK